MNKKKICENATLKSFYARRPRLNQIRKFRTFFCMMKIRQCLGKCMPSLTTHIHLYTNLHYSSGLYIYSTKIKFLCYQQSDCRSQLKCELNLQLICIKRLLIAGNKYSALFDALVQILLTEFVPQHRQKILFLADFNKNLHPI